MMTRVCEQFYLDLFNPWYNFLRVAGSASGYRHTDAAKQKMSFVQRNLSDESKKRKSTCQKGKKYSTETKQKISSSRVGKVFYLISPDDVLLKCENLKKFCRENNLHLSAMHRLLKGKSHHSQGYTLP